MLKDWWYASGETPVAGTEEKKIDFSGFTQALDAPEWIGVTLRYEAAEVLAGDWFTVVLPEPFADVQMQEGFVSPEGVALALTALEEPEHGMKLTVSFSAAGAAAGELPLQFRLTASEAVSLRLQERNEFMVIPPQVQQDTPQTNASENESEPEEQYSAVFLDNPEPEPKTFSIRGDIQFDETVDGFDWRSILRPLEFDQNIKIVATYNTNNEEQTVEYWAQDNLPLDAFYWMLTHDGEGGGRFEIANVPTQLTLKDGTTVTVTKYTVSIDTSLPYYQSSSFEVTEMSATQTLSTLKLTVKSQALKLAPEVVGDQTQQTFPMQLTFTNPNSEAVAQPSITETVNPTNIQPSVMRVPAGIQFQVVQEAVPGYKWDGSYTVTAKTGEQEPESTTSKSATGTIVEGTDVTVSTKNYMQNLTYLFTVKWVDNNNASRPPLGADNFQLQYKTENGEWTNLTEASLAALGIDQLPTFDASQAALWRYTYRGLPSNDSKGNELSYRVVAHDVTGYTVSSNETYKEFTYRKTTDFKATISWLDSNDADGKRPSALPLKLYRRAANGSYEKVATEPVVTQNGNTWTVSVPNLPCFNDQNQEYDYVIVQGSIGENNLVTQTPIDNYKTSYDNGTGNYANDIALCHNGGTMTQRISASVTFTATKVWKDPLTEPAQRPKVIVTLWRYSVPDGGDPGIDAMYNQNLAAQVIYRKTTETGNYQDVLLSYPLPKEDSTITFDSSTVSGLPTDFQLPAYDEQGRKYVYFVRETVDSDNYETSYAYGGETLAQGAPNGGTVTNTRREKALINITKVWQCPSNLPDIEGTSIQMKLQMQVEKDGTTEYKDLTVYSSDLGSFDKLTGDALTAAQTLSGFTENIATLDLQFFVNIYDENGEPYDMKKAIVKEIKVLKKNGETTDEITLTEQGTFELNGNQFIAASEYKGQTVLADGMQEFQYKETNTITGTRNYQLIKVWQGFDEKELANYASVSFKLERRSSKNGAQYETVKTPEGQDAWLVKKEENWQRVLENLPKYDHQGYEYLYSATEVAVIDTDGKPVEANWSSYHFRTEDLTRVTNYRGTGGSGAIYFSKQWMDNGDTEARKPVTVRVYRKADVAAALKNYSEDAVVSLSDLSIGHADYTLSTDNNWFAEAALSDVENQINATGKTSASEGELGYLILEYKVGSDGAVAAKYPVSQLKAAANGRESTISGTVSNSKRQYEVSVEWQDGGKQAYITNTRIGQASLEVTKEWKDENNASHLRPDSVQFRVYQDGLFYTPGTGATSITCEGAEWNPTTGIITVSKTDDTNKAPSWFFRLENLPLFSDTGVPHTYNLEEIGDGQLTVGGESKTGTFSYYLSTQGETTIRTNPGTPDLVTYEFTFDNTLTGTTRHTVHKTWQDRESGGCDRPDLYLTLYRYLKSEAEHSPDTPVEKLTSYQQYIDCEDPVWTVDDAYHWRAEVTGLPLYDDQGQEYVYRFQEQLNNGGVTVYGTYAQKAEYGVEANCGVCEASNISYDKPYDKFTNTLTGEMTISGVKTWTGFGGYEVEPKDYPAVTIELYRSLYSDIDPLNQKNDVVQKWIDEGRIEKTGKQVEMRYDPETGTYPTTYSFGTAVEGLPKFNEEGRRWYYTIREVFPSEIADSLYTEKYENGTLTNVFRKDVNRRSISVTKTWARRDNLEVGEDKYPSVTFDLYRYVDGQDTTNLEPLETVKIDASTFAESENGQYTHTFNDLLIYSPNGREYRYYITEKAIDGYTISYTDEDGISNNERSDVISIPDKPFDGNKHIVYVGTTNTYDKPGKITITGKKYWDDYGNSSLIYGKRPDTIEITLKRYTESESGQNNAVSSETIELANVESPNQPYIQWEKSVDGNPNYWKYTIHNLERYAPNGMPYVYSLTETPVEGYQQSNGTVSGTAGNQVDLRLDNLTNSLGATYYVRKNWMDGNNKYGLRPTSITVVLQRSIDGTNWENIQWDSSFGTYDKSTGKWTGLPSVTTDGAGKPIVSIKLTADNVMANTKGNSWQYTFTNLPEKDAARNTWKYRCIETHIENAAVKPVEGKENTYTAGAYTCTYPTQNDEKTVIQNKLESTSLHVTKIWEGDQNDLYHSRPDSLTFVLQMRGIKQLPVTPSEGNVEGGGGTGGSTEGEFELSSWMNVKKDGNDYTFTITKAQNWQKTLQDLPVAMVGEDGRTYYALYFRAVEIHADDTETVLGTKPVGAQNYEDRTDYTLGSADHSYNSDLTRNESKITNKLILDEQPKSISITKNWKRQAGTSATATFELLYKTAAEGEDAWHCFGNQTIGETWTGHTAENGCVLKTDSAIDTCSHNLTWTDLPKYDKDGNELVYKVVEHPLDGYKIEASSKDTNQNSVNLFTAISSLFGARETPATYDTEYTFTNIELQSYTVKKAWQNTDYAEKTDGGFTATFQLQQQVAGSGNWTDVAGAVQTLTATNANATQLHTWGDLPKYTTDGKQITYRAVETEINGKAVADNTNGAYIVTYQYDNGDSPAFAGTETIATNRMVYGFVNLSKAAAYLAPSVTADGDKKLAGVVFNIYSGTDTSKTPYVSNVVTDANGNLTRNPDGTYGKEQKYLISGTYTLKETSTKQGYSVWRNGVTFTVGVNGPEGLVKDTGEHGTAWISTSGIGNLVLSLKAEYKPSGQTSHTFVNTERCEPVKNGDNAYNLESRGVIQFTKTGSNGVPLDTHAGATGESKAYFGVYTDAACTVQVAGMMAALDGATMVLTTLAQDGTENATAFLAKKNEDDIPYLRKDKGVLTLLSGTYYLKELVAPPGYKLDSTVRTANVPTLLVTDNDSKNLSNVYSSNFATIEGLNENKWPNTENQVTLYKLDQYGRIVTLKDGGYLELIVEGEGNTFLTGEDTIRLYQNTGTPAKDKNGQTFDAGKVPNISYDAATGSWTIKGLFDVGKTYTLSEPKSSVPENNIQAKAFAFTMGADGSITVTAGAESKGNPLEVDGNDYENYYKSDSVNNIVVLRDVARFLTDVGLEKIDSKNNAKIANISFTLWKYDSQEANGTFTNLRSVLGIDAENNPIFLTTDANGKIQLSNTAPGVKNLVTGCDLRFGLDVGKYYFQEIEHGASDSYRLLDKIFFEIIPNQPTGESPNYQDYAKVVFDTPAEGSVSQIEGDRFATVKNTPVTEISKTLDLTKVDSENGVTKLSGAQFTLTYTSINEGTTGSHVTTTYYCVTGSNGVLYLRQGNTPDGQISSEKPDISKKGSYVLVETQAPDDYMTRTEDGTTNRVTMVTFDVNSENQITNVQCYNGKGELVSYGIAVETSGEHTALNLTVKNEKTVVSIAKRNDIESNTKTSDQKRLNGEPLSGAVLEIYKGVGATGTPLVTLSGSSEYTLEPGKLKENTIYTLREKQAPVGYLEAKDIYFKLFGTTMKDEQVVSQLYVWTGSGTPTVDGTGWSDSISIQDTVLTMVDEAIIAPVDLQKVVGDADSGYQALPGAIFEVKSLDGEGTVLGTAVTNANGYLEWKTIDTPNGLVFDAGGNRITANNKDSVIGNPIILQQNTNGYQFTETYASDNAYNDGRNFTVKITDQNYKDYRDSANKDDVYVDILEAGKATNNTVSQLTTRDNTPTADDVVNLPFKAAFELYKYDAEHPEIDSSHKNYEKIGLAGVTFTLSKKQANGNFQAVGTHDTGENGLLHIDLTEKGTYKLVETTPLTGYQKNGKEMEFTIVDGDYQKTLTYSEAEGNAYHTTVIPNAGGAATYDLPNNRIHGTVTLTKQDVNSGVNLNGVKYTLTRTDPVSSNVDKWFPSTGNSSLTMETGKTYTVVASAADEDAFNAGIQDTSGTNPGILVIQDLQWGTYKLVEQTEQSGYIRSTQEYTFEVKPDGLNLTQTVTNTKNQVTFRKTDTPDTGKNAKPLAGAVFEVHEGNACGETACTPVMFYDSASATTTVTTVTSGSDGTVTIYGLPTDNASDTPKTYHLVETTAPKGYKIAAPVTFTIDRYGKVRVQNADGNEVVMRDEPIELYIEKVGEDSRTKLSGAVFTLTDVCTGACDHLLANGESSETGITTGEGGKVMIPIERVIAGHTYMLEETKAPDGYECTAKVTFTVKPNGTAELVPEGTSGGYVKIDGETVISTTAVLDTNQTTITISNERIGLSLTKVDYDTKQPLKDVTFTLKPAEGSSFIDSFAPGNSSISLTKENDKIILATLTTDASGGISIPYRLVKRDNSYILTEQDLRTLYPNYRYSGETNHQITFKVEKDGTITITSRNAMFQLAEGDATALVVSNQQITLTVSKLDQATGTSLAGVKLKLRKLTTDPDTWTDVEEWTTDGIPKVFKGDTFTPGTYKLEEVETPEGYNPIAGPLTFTIDQSGKVTQTAVGEDSLAALTETSWTAKNFTITNPADGQPGGITLSVTNAAYSDLQITKQGSDGALLAGVEFRLDYLDGSNKTATATTAGDGENKGKATFSGLPNGRYRLTELKTAQGYNLLSAPLEIEIDRNGGIYTVSYNGGSDGTLTRQGNILSLTVINQKGLVLPATGTTTPQLPKAVLWFTALAEGLVLYLYQMSGRRRKRETKGKK